MRSWKRPVLGRLTATATLAALIGGLGLVAAEPAQAGGTTLKLDHVRCITQTDVFGDDSPYVLVFATSPSYSSAVQFGKWGRATSTGTSTPATPTTPAPRSPAGCRAAGHCGRC